MSEEEVIELSCQINVEELKKYQKAVHENTLEILEKLTEPGISEILEKSKVEKVLRTSEVFPEKEIESRVAAYSGKSRGMFLIGSLFHHFYHFGQYSIAQKFF